jgi:hypothetical protein
MKKKTIGIAFALFIVWMGLSLPAEAHGFRFSFGVSFGHGAGGYYPYGVSPWYSPMAYRVAAYSYRPVRVVRYAYPVTVYRTHPPRKGGHARVYGRYVPRRYNRPVGLPVYP